MNSKIKSYFDNLTPGATVQLDKAKDPELFKQSAMDYIDLYGHSIGFINNYSSITKYHKIPKQDEINYFFNY